MIRTYSELITFPTFEQRFEYLKLRGKVGESTFGPERYLNQVLYSSNAWQAVRRKVIIRDNSFDLGIEDYEIFDKPVIHHMNPITVEDIVNRNPKIFDPEFLICVSDRTHRAIHYGDKKLLPKVVMQRMPDDTTLWKSRRGKL